MILDNTRFMGGNVGVSTPASQLARRARMRLMGLADSTTDPAATGSTITDPGALTAAANSELTYLINLYRVQTGQQPLPANLAAPSVNVGVTSETLLVVGGIALLFFASRKKR